MGKRKIIIILLVLVIVIILFVVASGLILKDKDILNNENNSNDINNTVSKSNEIIKVESSADGYETYMLDASGNIYGAGFSLTENFEKINIETNEKIIDIVITDLGLLFKLDNGEVYLISNEIKSDKEIRTSLEIGSAKRIMIDDISMINDKSTAVSLIQFLTKSGELYELVANAYTGEVSNVKKIMDNVKKVESNGQNVVILDNMGNGYVYGYNVGENGVLGVSDYGIISRKDYISTPQKVGENLKEIRVASRSLMYSLNIYAINNNNELLIMGETANNNLFMGQKNNSIGTLTKIYENVDAVYPMMSGPIVKTKDKKLVSLDTVLYSAEAAEIIDDVDDVIVPIGYGGIFILKDNLLYGYGENDATGKFGIGEDIKILNSPIKINDNIKRVFISKDYSGSTVFLVKNDGTLYGAGDNYRGALGIAGKKSVKTFSVIDY